MRRDKLQMLADILKVASKPTKITKILRHANVQYYPFKEWSLRLIKAGLLVYEYGFFETTEEGDAWRLKVRRIYESLSKDSHEVSGPTASPSV